MTLTQTATTAATVSPLLERLLMNEVAPALAHDPLPIKNNYTSTTSINVNINIMESKIKLQQNHSHQYPYDASQLKYTPTSTPPPPVHLSSPTTDRKWSKNGFGESISSSMGKFTPVESQDVKGAINAFCIKHEISPGKLCTDHLSKSKGNDDVKGAWMEISRKLPHRTVQSIYRHGLRLMHPFKRGAWTEDESTKLLKMVAEIGKKWSHIQPILNRSADSCRDKHREFSQEYNKGRWKQSETESLVRHIQEVLKADSSVEIQELGQIVENRGVILPWSTISKMMGRRSRLSCFKRWQKLTRVGRLTHSIGGRCSRPKRKLTQVQSPSSSLEPYDCSTETIDHSERKIRKNQSQRLSPDLSLTTATSAVSTLYTAALVMPTPNPIKIVVGSTNPIPSYFNNITRITKICGTAPSNLAENSIAPVVPSQTMTTPTDIASREMFLSHDRILLLTLSASTDYVSVGDIPWETIQHYMVDAHTRWNRLFNKWIVNLREENEAIINEWMSKPIWELARIILEAQGMCSGRGVNRLEEVEEGGANAGEVDQAEIADRTVEAVDLPIV